MILKTKGFTLVELMVTVVVSAILITIAIPSFSSLYEGQRASSNMSTIKSSLQFARSQAVSYGSRVSICPFNGTSCGSDWTQGFSIFIDNGTLGSLDSTNGIQDTILRTVDSFNSDDFIKSSASRYTFNTDGLMNLGLSGSIVYCPGSTTNPDSKGISIGISGRISDIESSVDCQ
ncbi:GspH/FimT family pseudopilin [Shewanella sp. 10N.286.52.A9]|uniref:GspH/FimT family pseudopilin n=1 Tax=Shewanella sp. 10N.286.52.A9 TaxID=3229711 RepID=UPI00354D9211